MGGIYWLASYPKSGNTWFRSVLANFMSDSGLPVDINSLNTGSIASSREWVDDVLGTNTADMSQDEVEYLRPDVYRWSVREDSTQIRYHKIHDAYSRRPDGRPLVDDIATLGAVYIIRNPLDVAPSLANHNNVDIDTAIAQMSDPAHALARSGRKLSAQLLQRLGTWSHHVQSWVDACDLKTYVLRYEDMQANPVASFDLAFRFLGLPDRPEKLTRAIADCRFEKLAAQEEMNGFRERPAKTARFFRKGMVGDWRNTLTKEQAFRVVRDHETVMRRFGYIDEAGRPLF
jgi:hypothetical protein